MTQKNHVTYDDNTWRKGTRGLAGAWATDRPHILNMRLAIDGSLVQRPWYRNSSDLTTRTSSDAIVFPARYYDTGLNIYREGYFFSDSTSSAFYVHGSATAIATGTAIPNVTRTTTKSQVGGTTWIVNDQQVELTGAGTITIVDAGAAIQSRFVVGTDVINVTGSAVHQGRAFYWGEEETSGGLLIRANRIWYSDPYDYATFTSADQFFDVDSSIEGCQAVGANLYIWTGTGDWFVLQGRGNPADGTLNTVGLAPIPAKFSYVVRQDNSLYFLSADKTKVVKVTEGGVIDDVSYGDIGFDASGELPSANGALPPTASSLQNSIYIPNDDDAGESDALHMLNHIWTEEELGGILTTHFAIVGTSETSSREMLAIYTGGRWIIYRREILAAAPTESPTSFIENPGGFVTLPRISDPMVATRVTRLIIDGRYWRGDGLGGSVGPYLDPAMNVSAYDGYGNTTTFALGPDNMDLSTLPEGEGLPIRITAHPASDGVMPFSPFIDMTLGDIQSLTIERVRVEYETTNSRNY